MAGVSAPEGKKEIMVWIQKNYPNRKTPILDIGAGAGIYGRMLKDLGYTMVDALEYEPSYVMRFGQYHIYHQVFLGDMRTYEPIKHYDVVILGDCLEHISEAEALATLSIHGGSDRIVSIPWHYKQDAEDGIECERHIQDDLSKVSVDRIYQPDLWVLNGSIIGCFIKLKES